MRHHRLSVPVWVIASAAVLAGAAVAGVKLSATISDNMVLQRTAKAPIWGWAAPGQKVTVTFNDQSASATADEKGGVAGNAGYVETRDNPW